MNIKSKYPKETVGVRLKPSTLKKVDQIAERREEKRSETLRILIESAVQNYELLN